MTDFTAADALFDFDAASGNGLPNEVGFGETEPLSQFSRYPTDQNQQAATDFTAADALFDYDAAAEKEMPNVVGSRELEPLSRHPTDLTPEAKDSMNTQPIQQADQRATISDPSPAMAPVPSADNLHQQNSSLSHMDETMGTGSFTYGERPTSYQPILQQQQTTYPQVNFQQQQPAPASACQSMGFVNNTYNRPPARCQFHTRMWQQHFGPSSMDEQLQPRPYIHQGSPAPSSPITQQQDTPFQPSNLPPKLRPQGLLKRPIQFLQDPQRFPAGPSQESAQRYPPAAALTQNLRPTGHLQPRHAIPDHSFRALPTGPRWKPPQSSPLALPPLQQQEHPQTTTPLPQQGPGPSPFTTQQQGASSSPIPTPPKTPSTPKTPSNTTTTGNTKHAPIKGSKPTGITKRPSQPRGRKPIDHDNTAWVTETVPPEMHTNTVYGRNMLRSKERLAQPYNQQSVRSKDRDDTER